MRELKNPILGMAVLLVSGFNFALTADEGKNWPNPEDLLASKNPDRPVLVRRFEEPDRTWVCGLIYVPKGPEAIWRVMSSCDEVVEMVPQIQQCEVRERNGEAAVIYHKVKISSFFPALQYLLDASFEDSKRIRIHLREGDLKAFDGSWEIDRRSTPEESWVTIRLYMNPGTLIPQGFVNGKLEKHIPRVMSSFRDRVMGTAG